MTKMKSGRLCRKKLSRYIFVREGTEQGSIHKTMENEEEIKINLVSI